MKKVVTASKSKKVATSSKKKVVAPAKKVMTKCERNKMIRDLYASGNYTCRSLAEKVGLSKTRISELVR